MAAQGTVFQLLGHTNRDGGWDKVRGPTVTGWISADLGYAAPGRFGYYTSSAFNVLFPAGRDISHIPSRRLPDGVRKPGRSARGRRTD
jgi:hypothetical protein